MVDLSLYADGLPDMDKEDFEARKAHEINLRKQQRDRVLTTFKYGYIDESEMIRELELLDREILVWTAKTSDREQIELESDVTHISGSSMLILNHKGAEGTKQPRKIVDPKR